MLNFNIVLASSWFDQIANFFNTLISGFQYVVNHFVSMGKALTNLFVVLPSALALPGYMSQSLPTEFVTVLSIGITVSLLAIVLPGAIGGKK